MPSLQEFITSHKFGVRGEQFAYLANLLLQLYRPVVIVETGSMRPSLHPDQDGQSTRVWDYVVSEAGGKCFTVDIDPEHSRYTQKLVSRFTEVVTSDSIEFLRGIMPPTPQLIDLAYFDSLDWGGSELEKMESALHHVGELAAIWHHIAPGGIVAVDDCYGEYEGKQAMIEAFFNLIKIGPIMTGPIYAWRKPCPQN